MTNTLCIDYDDDALAIMDRVNVILKPHGLVFENDEKDHDGFVVYNFKELKDAD